MLDNPNVKKIRQIWKLFVPIAVIVFCVALATYWEVRTEYHITDPEYSFAIGKRFQLKKDLLVLGVSSDNQPPADYFRLVPEPGFAGPEVVSRDNLDSGTVLQIKKVLTGYQIYTIRVQYVVEAMNTDYFSNKQLRVAVAGEMDDSTFGLDSNYYQTIDLPTDSPD